jgi:enolase
MKPDLEQRSKEIRDEIIERVAMDVSPEEVNTTAIDRLAFRCAFLENKLRIEQEMNKEREYTEREKW